MIQDEVGGVFETAESNGALRCFFCFLDVIPSDESNRTEIPRGSEAQESP